jgi:protoporphyrinogen/coproporphyrinogen III oxidase
VTEEPNKSRRIAVVGGGISGLAAAHRLVELAPRDEVVLFEEQNRLGGVLETIHEDGFQIEQSADNFITTFPWAVDLCKRLGLSDNLVQTNPQFRRTFVVRRGRLRPLPDGFLMMAPSRMWPLATTPILSPLGKARAAMEYFIPPRAGESDESMAGFVRRRLGREVFQRLVEPLISAVYAADMEKLSLLATMPRFRQMEKEHGGLIRAMRKQMRSARQPQTQSGPRYSMFVTLEEGLSSLVAAIAAKLPDDAIRLETPVARIDQTVGTWTLTLGDGTTETFDGLILATPSHVAARLLGSVDDELSRQLGGILHSGTAIVTVAYNRDQIAHPMDGMGFVVPSIERRPILAGSFSSQKYTHRAPEGKTLIRVFAGGDQNPQMAEMEDERLVPLVREELAVLLGIKGDPIYHTVAHWPGTMPQYHVGHLELVERIQALVSRLPNLAVAGNAFTGVGIPHCIHTGELAAEAISSATEATSSAASRT